MVAAMLRVGAGVLAGALAGAKAAGWANRVGGDAGG
jgi:hypothetical protein